MYTSVLFDLDGTLLDTLDDLTAAGNHALTLLDLPTHSSESFRQMVGSGIENLVRRMLPSDRLGGATEELALSLFRSYYSAHMNDQTRPYPGILSLLHRLRQKGLGLAVLSNKSHEHVLPILDTHFPGLFDFSVGQQEGIPLKPDPTSARKLLEQMDADPARTLYCGDSGVDMLTARNAGLPACGVLWGFRDRDELSEAGADFLVEDVAALERILLEPH